MQYGSSTEPAELFAPDLGTRALARGGLWGDLWKSFFDRLVAVIALLILFPLMATVAVAILISDGRPIFFGHARVGRYGRVFHCLKFRTMVRDAEDRLQTLLASDPVARREWESHRKLRHDPRVLPFGGLLRKLSIDELPQFLNVLRGDMSLVGPRPITAEELGGYGANAAAYMSVRPGVTGLWQVSGRSGLEFSDRVRLDMAYVATRSFLGDLRIILRTPLVVLRGSGAC
ncbi:sugar transferase [Jannaschia seohaensis]|uniref:Exopolysaccharide production protein ExoY n=1 Tax=Jannaschia seohaensis TaxID=475081 RepID=A0A2Y9A1M9_9RHOB|nr:sugar transferase [Jannaschia seohaensis]PWJ22173.1 exopolysaccharide production protein ExoY [Jannaschia seohaensis]SSA38451.1 exopolysaccharide production protein ExoY [Jannaschia seohaensis]